jgi:CheY-like chemotaxis protein
MPERLVLCVDDEAILLLALRHRLESVLGPGYRCETALSGESALAALEGIHAAGGRLEAVVSDWRMPGMKGDEVLRAARARFPDARLALLTGYADREELLALDSELGLAGILQKPCDLRELAALIRGR